MPRIDFRDCIDASSVADPELRKNVFREMARDFTQEWKEGGVTDRPGTIARMMEAAYRAGLEAPRQAMQAGPARTPRRSTPRRFTDMDVPSFPRDRLFNLRLWMFGASPMRDPDNRYPANGTHEPHSGQLALVMRPALPGYPSSVSRDEWMLASFGPGKGETFSNKAVLPLIKLGLYQATEPMEGGWRFATLTEWGFELLATGGTTMPDERMPGRSSTYERYRAAAGDGHLLRNAAVALGVIEREDADEPRAGPSPR